MATFSITTTPDQDAGIAAAVKAANDVIDAWNTANPVLPQQTRWTGVAYARAMIGALLDGWADRVSQSDQQQLRQAWQDPTKRAAIKVAAGIT